MYGDKARTEVERKFRVVGDGWRAGADGGTRVRQGFLSEGETGTVRVRCVLGKGILTVKGPTVGISREEFEYEIPLDDAERMLETLCFGEVIDKVRYRIPAGGGLEWEVDVFEGSNAGLVVAELELATEDQPFSRPDWLGEEVSEDHRFFNVHLARHPHSTWDRD